MSAPSRRPRARRDEGRSARGRGRRGLWFFAVGSVLGGAIAMGSVSGCAMGLRASGPPTEVDAATDVALLGVETVPGETAPDGEDGRLLALLAEIQGRHLQELIAASLDVSAYYIGYDLTDRRSLWMEASGGSIIARNRDQRRLVDVDVRVGGRELDNGDPRAGFERNGLGAGVVITESLAPLALEQRLWLVTNAQFKLALESHAEVASEVALLEIEDDPPSFTPAQRRRGLQRPSSFDPVAVEAAWAPRLEALSRALEGDPSVIQGSATLDVTHERHALVDTDDGQVLSARASVRVGLSVVAQADDGMVLERFESFDGHLLDQLPEQSVMLDVATRLREEVVALSRAPLAEPYSGPALLDGRAAAVFFHEIFGHRLEGHRQRSAAEGQTFANMVGRPILPTFLDVVDDPTVVSLDGVPLSGAYVFDDEGIRARRVHLVEGGVLRDFLRDRTPVREGEASNGHGRRQPGHQVVARQGNLLVTARATMPVERMRAALVVQARRQGKPYGLWFREISGGYTSTERSGPQTFEVLPVEVWKVYVDGRPDELVRGVDIVGTPLSALETIVAAGDDLEVFNGVCGAESGWVPVSAASPSILLEQLEIERGEPSSGTPPLLPAPERAPADARGGAR